MAKELSISRFELKYSVGTLPHDKLMRSIEPQFRDYANTARTPVERKTQSYERAGRKAHGNGSGANAGAAPAELPVP